MRRELSPTRTRKWTGRNHVQITCNTSSAYHVQPAVYHLVRRDSSAIKFDRVEIAFNLTLFYWLKSLTDEGGGGGGGGGNRRTRRKTPDDELQKMPHTKARQFKPQARLEPALSHWWQAGKADVLTITPRVAPLLYSFWSRGVEEESTVPTLPFEVSGQ